MKILFRVLGIAILFAWLTSVASAGEISGRVKGPDGAAFKGAFVRAQNEITKITVDVLSDKAGAYRIQNLDPGEYQVTIGAVGYKTDPHPVKIDTDQPVVVDIALQKGTVRWSDLSIHEGQELLPEGPGKHLLFFRCMSCHGLQTKIAAVRRDEEGWQGCVTLMRSRESGVGDLLVALGKIGVVRHRRRTGHGACDDDFVFHAALAVYAVVV